MAPIIGSGIFESEDSGATPILPTPVAPGPPASLVDAVNVALVSIGDSPITALDEDSDRARVALTFAQALLDELLREHDWNFARVRTQLVELTPAPAFGYDHQYALPTDPYCLMVRETSLAAEQAYAIETAANGQRVLVTDALPVSIVYTGRLLDSSLWDPLFRMGYANRLAAEFAYPITSKAEFAETLWRKAEARLRRGKAVDGLEGRQKKGFVSDALTRVR
jgi:hypothetical protein